MEPKLDEYEELLTNNRIWIGNLFDGIVKEDFKANIRRAWPVR